MCVAGGHGYNLRNDSTRRTPRHVKLIDSRIRQHDDEGRLCPANRRKLRRAPARVLGHMHDDSRQPVVKHFHAQASTLGLSFGPSILSSDSLLVKAARSPDKMWYQASRPSAAQF